MTRRLPVLAAAVVLALSGCSGEEQPAAAPEVDPRQAYVEQASDICTEADERFSALPQPTTPEQFGPYVEQTIAIAEQAQDDLSALTPPEEDRAELERRVLTPFAALVEEGRAFAAEVEAAGTDQDALLALLPQRPTSADVDVEYLRSYGLPSCADAIAQVG